jgi:hypothetical protein
MMPFLDNKYTVWYYQIIIRAQHRILDERGEYHHIIPRCMGGSDDKANIVKLTTREHFICHWLLSKMTRGKDNTSLLYALNGMKRSSKYQNRYETKITSRVYARLKNIIAEEVSSSAKGKAPAINAITRMPLGKIAISDTRWQTGEIVGQTQGKSSTFGKASAKDHATGEHLGSISTSDTRWVTGEIVSTLTGLVRTDNHKQKIKEARVKGLLNGSIVIWNKGKKTGPNTLGGTAPAKDSKTSNKLGRIPLIDHRWQTGEIVGSRKKLF